MAGDSLIERYLLAFEAQVRLRSDRADLVDEVADHLFSAAERLEGRGLDHETAESGALVALGEPRIVASLMTTSSPKGPIMPYFFSRHVWVLSVVAAAAWITAGIASLWGFTELFGWTRSEYYAASGFLAVACLATTGVLVGANLRAVGRFDRATAWMTVLGVGAGLLCATGAAWIVGAWVPLLVIAVAWTLSRMIQTGSGVQPAHRGVRMAVRLVVFSAVAVTVIGIAGQVESDWAILALIGLMTLALVAAVVELAILPKRQSLPANAV